MNIPSVKTLMTLPSDMGWEDRHSGAVVSSGSTLTREQAIEVRRACERGKGLSCYNRIIGAHGQEYIALPDGCLENCQEPKVSIWYVNRGDTYDRTLMKVNGRYRVGDWGSVVEKFDR